VPQQASKSRIELKPTQERVLAVLAEDGSGRLTRGRYEDIAGVSRSQAAYDLAELVGAGILERVGGGRATTYRLVRRARQPGQRHWTNERIHTALVDFCAGRKTWPSASEFKADGRSDLYVAASRYGGIGFWATELGFAQPSRTAPMQTRRAPLRSWRPQLRWAAAGAAVAGALFAVAGGAHYAGVGVPARQTTASPSATASSSTRQDIPALSKPVASPRAAPAKPAPRPAQRDARPPVRSAASHTPTSGYRTQLAVQYISTPTSSHASTARQGSTEPAPSSAGPAPLTAPASARTAPPAPLPPPR
jgi:hypothetical protein